MVWRMWLVIICLTAIGQSLIAEESVPALQRTRVDNKAMLIHIDEDHLTVKLQEAPLSAVLKEIGRQAAIEISMPGVLTKTISMEFRDLPLEEGLRKLLRGYGWVMFHAGSTSWGGRTLTKVLVVPAGEGRRPAEQESPPEPKEEGTLAGAVSTLLNKEEVKAHLDVYLHGSNARARRNAFRSLIGAVNVEDFWFLIDMLRADNVQPMEWEVALAPVFGLMTSEEQALLLSSLRDRTARESIVETFESYRLYKAREEAKTR